MQSDADADEVVTDVFVEAWKRAIEFDEPRGTAAA